MSIAARLYVQAPLAEGLVVQPDTAQTHYLRHVLRLEAGAPLALFNGRDGEWRARLAVAARRGLSLIVEAMRRPQEPAPDLWLLAAPVKRAPLDLIAEKATELGIARLLPVLTRRSVVARVNVERLHAIAREAAEQSERLTVPEIAEPVALDRAVALFPPERLLLVADEGGGAPPIAEVLAGLGPLSGGAAVLTGPEGGFAPGELDAVLKLPFARPAGLGPRILRADTAAISTLAVFQALAGDWRRARHRSDGTF